MIIKANVFAVVLAAFTLPGLGGCPQQETKLNTTDDDACRKAVTTNPRITYEDCRREAAKRNAPPSPQQDNKQTPPQDNKQSGSSY
jgi:hypothetical protein